jgi:uncharacterized membrane protein YeaQ/YmgE (transglycosylase-associated protein family)
MNPWIWCAIGIAAGWVAGMLTPMPGFANRIETLFVGVFGAFIGGELAALFLPGADLAAVTPTSVALAFGGAVAMLFLLALMRRVVGPMRPHKIRKKPRI